MPAKKTKKSRPVSTPVVLKQDSKARPVLAAPPTPPTSAPTEAIALKLKKKKTSVGQDIPSNEHPVLLQEPIVIGGVKVAPGTEVSIDIPVVHLHTYTPVIIPAQVIHGQTSGPRLFVSAGIHGDEVIGLEIIRRIIANSNWRGTLRGTVILTPVVNILGLLNQTRYLPDSRDLNRAFPGVHKGSMAARIADTYMREIVQNCTHGIDIHTGAVHRPNLPQVRGLFSNPEIKRMAMAFGAPVAVDSALRNNDLRAAANTVGVPVLIYEGGEALRFDEIAIRAGVKGILNVLRELGMIQLKLKKSTHPASDPAIAHASSWQRAPSGGILRTACFLGSYVRIGDVLGTISNHMGHHAIEVKATVEGIVISRTVTPIVNQGEGLFYIAHVANARKVDHYAEKHHEYLDDDPEGAQLVY